MISYTVKVEKIVEETKGTKTFYFEKPEDLTWEEGAHVHIGLEGFDTGEAPDKALVHHMSIMSLPDEGYIGITTRCPGSHSVFKSKLDALKPGDCVKLFKVGSRMTLRREHRPIVLLSMGVGIATMRPLMFTFLKNPECISRLTNVSIDASGSFVFHDVLEALVTENFSNLWFESRLDFYDALPSLALGSNAIFYIVGSDGFLKDVIRSLSEFGINPDDIVIDKKPEQIAIFFE